MVRSARHAPTSWPPAGSLEPSAVVAPCMSRVAVASRSFSRNEVLRAELLSRFPETSFNEIGRTLAGAELIRFLSGHDRAIVSL